jgi:hypothetical protein
LNLELARPRQAAVSFARCRALDRRGELAADALAREVDSWSAAGETALARQRAAEYIRAYPRGERWEDLRKVLVGE